MTVKEIDKEIEELKKERDEIDEQIRSLNKLKDEKARKECIKKYSSIFFAIGVSKFAEFAAKNYFSYAKLTDEERKERDCIRAKWMLDTALRGGVSYDDDTISFIKETLNL